MKRFLAVFLAALCCLMLLVPAAVAAPSEEDPAAADTPAETTDSAQTDPAADSASDSNAEQPSDSSTDTASDTPAEPQPDVDPLSGETAIQSVQITVVVDESGKASVTQVMQMAIVGSESQLRFAFPDTSKSRKVEGWRTKSSSENGLHYLTVTNDAGFTGEQTFTLTYTQDGLVSEGDQSQKLALPLLAAQDYRIGSISLAVNLPKEFSTRPNFSSGYYGEIIEDYMTIEVLPTAVTAIVNNILQDNDTLMMNQTLPDGYFKGSFATGTLTTVMTVLTAVVLVAVLLLWWRTLRNPALRVQSRTLPPDGVNPGDLPFLLAGGDADFNMLVSYWASLGYLSFYINQKGHVILRRRMDMGNERRPFERKLFDWLFGNDTVCDGASLRYKRVGERAMSLIPHYWGRRLYDRRSGSPFLVRLLCCLACAFATVCAMDTVAPLKLHGLFLFLGFIAGFALCWMTLGAMGAFFLSDWVRTGIGACCGLLLLILGGLGSATLVMVPAVAMALFISWQTLHGGLRNAYGNEIISQTLGFRRFLLHVSAHHLQQMLRRDPQFFYKMLPYAQAMGLGRRFVNLFQDARLEPCQWYESARDIPQTASAFYDHYLDTLDMLNISIKR